MDDLRGTFSILKKDIKNRLTRGKRRADKTRRGEGTDSERADSERADSLSSLPRPEPDIMTDGGREREGGGSNAEDKSVKPAAGVDENKSDWKSTASASAKLLLRGVRDSADAFPPLKSVAGGLCFILENCEVWSPLP